METKNEAWLQAYESFEKGKAHYLSNRYEEALACFDSAVRGGFKSGDLFSSRASILQTQEWQLDAIDDFTRAIALEPEDCNYYFQRAMSRISIGDQDGFNKDIQEAIRLSRFKTRLNQIYNEQANEMGHQSVTALYELQSLAHAQTPDFILERNANRAASKGRRSVKVG